MLRNTETSWGSLARILHWGLAIFIVAMFAYGLWMKSLPVREDRVYHYGIHASVGISILVMMLLRVFWRVANPTPLPPRNSPAWELTAARLGHLGLYLIVFGALLSGWFLAGSGKAYLDFYLFGVVPVPNLLGVNSPYHGFFEEAHELTTYGVIALVLVHIAASVWHDKFHKHGLIARMITGKPSASV